MNENPLISVVLTTYNRMDIFPKTLDTILCQTYKNFELIIVDDGSTDNTEEIIKHYNGSRIRYIKTDHCGVMARQRNIGLKQSKGKYIAFCDDDDLWDPKKLEMQLDFMEKNNAGICFCNYYKINQDGKIVGEGKIKKKYINPTFTNFFLSAGYICNSSVMIKSVCVDKLGYQNESPELIAIEDSEYWARILSIYNGCFLQEKLVSYRVHQGSIQIRVGNSYLMEQLLFYKAICERFNISFHLRFVKILKIYTQNMLNKLMFGLFE